MKVSVILPVYNAKDYLKIACDSLFQSIFQDFEVIAIDDGSTDGSLEILHAISKNEPRLKILTQAHQGIVQALNYGISESKGTYIARMDADDISHPDRLEKQIAYLEGHPDAIAVGSWVRFIDDKNRPFFIYQTPIKNESIVAALWQGNGGAMVHPSVLFRKSAMDAVGRYREAYRSLEDLDLYLRMIGKGSYYNLPEVLLDYRQHFQSVNYSSRHEARHKLHFQLMQEHCKNAGKPFPTLTEAVHQKTPDQIYWQWANWALESHFFSSAWIYAIKALATSSLKITTYLMALQLAFKTLKMILDKGFRKLKTLFFP
jgi:glycosyltransferase involved in cell wall biosynthesis